MERLPSKGMAPLNASTSLNNTMRVEQSLEDAYGLPENFLEIEVVDPQNHGFGNQMFTDYEIVLNVSHLGVRNGVDA